MKYKKFNDTYFLRIDKGEEIIESITRLCEKERITLGKISAIGATNKATIGLFDTDKKQYFSKEFSGDHEITSITGNITQKDKKPYIHAHITIADKNQNVFGGHLSSATVSATCEAVITAFKGYVERKPDEEIGINLLKFD